MSKFGEASVVMIVGLQIRTSFVFLLVLRVVSGLKLNLSVSIALLVGFFVSLFAKTWFSDFRYESHFWK